MAPSNPTLNSPNTVEHGITEGFEWKEDYQDLMEKAAADNLVQEWDWPVMCNALKHQIHRTIGQYLQKQGTSSLGPTISGSSAMAAPGSDDTIPGTPLMTESPSQMTIAISPSAIEPRPSTMHGLIIPPFPPNPGNRKLLPAALTIADANEFMERLYEMLDEFEEHPPFTIQRVCELLLQPARLYRTLGKFLRALERTLLVTSTADQFTIDTFGDASQPNPNAAPSDHILKLAKTPLFSPIPFLHPEMDPVTGQVHPTSRDAISAPSPMMLDDDEPPPPSPRLGLVDEMDDPDDEHHMSEHPKALSSTTSLAPDNPGNRMVVEGPPLLGSSDIGLYSYTSGLGLGFGPPTGLAVNTPSLEERFVRSSTPEPEAGRVLAEKERVKQEKEDAQKKKKGPQVTGKEPGPNDNVTEEDMVLDEDDDAGKENINAKSK